MSRKLIYPLRLFCFSHTITPKGEIILAKKDTSANSDIQIFCYKAMPARTTEIDGEMWFVAKDVADILEMRDAYNATRELDEDEKGTCKVSTPAEYRK